VSFLHVPTRDTFKPRPERRRKVMTMEKREMTRAEVEKAAADVVSTYVARGLERAASLVIAAEDPEDSKAIDGAILQAAGQLAPRLVTALIEARGRQIGDGSTLGRDVLAAELNDLLSGAFCSGL
jgi:hypothetical protein